MLFIQIGLLYSLMKSLKNSSYLCTFNDYPLSNWFLPWCRDTLEVYSKKLKDLAMDILGHLAKALGIEEVEIRELFEDGIQMMRMNYYPPSPEPEKVIGLTNHSDPQALTILLQLNEPEGLQIRKDGMWVPVNPLPNSFIVNVGDILEVTK